MRRPSGGRRHRARPHAAVSASAAVAASRRSFPGQPAQKRPRRITSQRGRRTARRSPSRSALARRRAPARPPARCARTPRCAPPRGRRPPRGPSRRARSAVAGGGLEGAQGVERWETRSRHVRKAHDRRENWSLVRMDLAIWLLGQRSHAATEAVFEALVRLYGARFATAFFVPASPPTAARRDRGAPRSPRSRARWRPPRR